MRLAGGDPNEAYLALSIRMRLLCWPALSSRLSVDLGCCAVRLDGDEEARPAHREGRAPLLTPCTISSLEPFVTCKSR